MEEEILDKLKNKEDIQFCEKDKISYESELSNKQLKKEDFKFQRNIKKYNFKMNSNDNNNMDDRFRTICELTAISNRSNLQSNSIRDYIISIANINSFYGIYKDELSYHIHIHNLSQAISYQFTPENKILFKLGDTGDRYYIILNGSVDILIPKWVEMQISKKEYFVYLAKFRLYKEDSLLQEILDKNKEKLKLNISDVDKFIDHETKEHELEKQRKSLVNQQIPVIQYFKVIKAASQKRRASLNLNKILFNSNDILQTMMKNSNNKFENNKPSSNTGMSNPDKNISRDIIKKKLILSDGGSNSKFLDNASAQKVLNKNFSNKNEILGHQNSSIKKKYKSFFENEERKNYFQSKIPSNLDMIPEDQHSENLIKSDFMDHNKNSYKYFECQSFAIKKNNLSPCNRESPESGSSVIPPSSIVKFYKNEEGEKNVNDSDLELEIEKADNFSSGYFKNQQDDLSQVPEKRGIFHALKSNNFLSNYEEREHKSQKIAHSLDKPLKTFFKQRSLSLVPGLLNSLAKFQENYVESLNKEDKETTVFKLKNIKKIRNKSLESSDEELKRYLESSEIKAETSISTSVCNKDKYKNGHYNENARDKNLNFFDDYYKKYIHDKWEMNDINSDDYLSRLSVFKSTKTEKLDKLRQDDKCNLYNLSMINYTKIKTLKAGEIFGEVALNEENKKRTATIITSLPTHFGWSNKDYYDHILSESKTKSIQNEVVNLLNCPIFKNHNKITFYREIYFTLQKKYVIRSELIFKEGDELKNIIFLNEGEFILKVKKSFLEINDLIRKLCGTPINENFEHEEISNNDEFRKFMETKNETKVYFINKTDVIGIDDYTINNKFLFDLECISPKGKIFLMDKENFKAHEENNKNLKEHVAKYQKEKRRNIISRLNDIKRSKISMFKRDNKDNSESIDKILKTSTECYFSHKEINPIEKETLASDKRKIIKKTIHKLQKFSLKEPPKDFDDFENEEKLKLSGEFVEAVSRNTSYKSNDIAVSENVKNEILSSIKLRKVNNEAFSQIDDNNNNFQKIEKIKINYLKNKGPLSHSMSVKTKQSKENINTLKLSKILDIESNFFYKNNPEHLSFRKEKTNPYSIKVGDSKNDSFFDHNFKGEMHFMQCNNVKGPPISDSNGGIKIEIEKKHRLINSKKSPSDLANDLKNLKLSDKNKEASKTGQNFLGINNFKNYKILPSEPKNLKARLELNRNYISHNQLRFNKATFDNKNSIINGLGKSETQHKTFYFKNNFDSEFNSTYTTISSNLKFPKIFESPLKRNKPTFYSETENKNMRSTSNFACAHDIEISIIRFSQMNGNKLD